jgi:LysR family transcriptional regulator, cell division regulator
MNSADLKIFESVAAHSSFTKAAEDMFTVQSNVTARIKSLEEEFHVPFFKRTSRSVELTAAGEIFIQFSKRINHLIEEVRQELAGSDRLSGSLKIGCIETTMALKVPGVISHFTDRYPDVSLQFKADNSPNLTNDVLNYKLDAAFVGAPVTAAGLAMQVVKEERLVIVTAADHPGLAELKKKPVKIIVFDQGCSYRPRLELWLGQKGIVNYQCTVLNTLEGIINFVEAGIGITILPADLIEQHYHSRKLKTYPVKGELGTMTTLLVYRKDIPPTRALKAFMELF